MSNNPQNAKGKVKMETANLVEMNNWYFLIHAPTKPPKPLPDLHHIRYKYRLMILPQAINMIAEWRDQNSLWNMRTRLRKASTDAALVRTKYKSRVVHSHRSVPPNSSPPARVHSFLHPTARRLFSSAFPETTFVEHNNIRNNTVTIH